MRLVASSLETPDGQAFTVRGRFEGTVLVRGGWIDIIVPAATIAFRQSVVDIRYRSLRVRAALASGSQPRPWRIISESRAIPLRPLLARALTSADSAQRVLVDTLRFEVPLPRELPADRVWIAFEFEFVDTSASGFCQLAWTYAHAEPPLQVSR